MITKRLTTAVMIALSLAAGPAVTQEATPAAAETPSIQYLPQTSGELLDLIRDCDDDICMSYVSGAIGGIAIYAILADRASPFCSQDAIDTVEIRDAIVRTIETTPELLDQHPALSILTAFGRTWPCTTVSTLPGTEIKPLEQTQVDALLASNGHSLVEGNTDAEANRTILVFHDPNCVHCRRFTSETDALIARGWKVITYPVATTTEDSAGYGAVQIALRDISAEAVQAIHDHDPEGVADIALASEIAEQAGMSSRDILTAIARAGAYETIEANTASFFALGATGTPSWIVGTNLYGGYLTAEAIEKITEGTEAVQTAPSPQDTTAAEPEPQE